MTALALPGAIDTVAELRALYRAAEARAARLRLLVEAGRDLASADTDALPSVLASAAKRAALFSGHADGSAVVGEALDGMPLIAPGADQRQVGTLRLKGGPASEAMDAEDLEALTMLAQLMASAIDRLSRDAERDRLLSSLQERERRLETVIDRLFGAQEEERRRVSRELHDGVAQTATALFRRLEAHAGHGADQDLQASALMAQQLVREIRAAIADLRPTALDDLGLIPAVAALAQGLSDGGYDVALTTSGPDRWPPLLETAFFRVAQEAVTNIRKHAGGPCRVEIELSGDARRSSWRLRVRDHGQGPLPSTVSGEAPGNRIGMAVMRERLGAVGGRLSVGAAKPRGLELLAVVESEG